MIPSKIDILLDWLIQYGVGPLITAGILFALIKYIFPGYLSEKAKNIATKEDIEEITEKVESIKTGYAEIIEATKNENQLKASAIAREKLLKKEVFMDAVEAIVRAQSVIGNIANMNFTEEQLGKEFSAESGKIAKVQLVGNEETVRAITNFMGELATIFIELILVRASLTMRKIDIDIAAKSRDQYQSEVERYISVMKSMDLAGNSDEAAWDSVNRSFEFEVEQRDKHNEELNELWSSQTKEQIQLSRKCSDKFFEISRMLPELIISVRNEIDLPIDSDSYTKIYHDSLKKGIAIMSEFYSELEVK